MDDVERIAAGLDAADADKLACMGRISRADQRCAHLGVSRMTHTTNDAPVTVEQCDQTLVAEILEAAETMQIAGNDIAAIRNGIWNEDESDLGFLLQIAARHRLAPLASAPAGDGDAIERMRAAVEADEYLDGIRIDHSDALVILAALARPRAAVGEREA